MNYKRHKNQIYLRADQGEEVLEKILEVCVLENVTGFFQGIGACSRVVVGTFIKELKDYIDHEVKGSIEIVSLSGSTTLDESGKMGIHGHGVFSYIDENNEVKVIGGHIKSAVISFTGEVIINLIDTPITKKYDPRIGINVWDFKK